MRRKVRSDAVLLNLPDERQEQIIEWCDTPKSEGCPGGYQFAREQLAADGLNVSTRAVSDFYSSWHLQQDLTLARQVEDTVKLARPGEAKLAREAGEAMLLKLSLAKQDPKLFSAATVSIDMRRSLDLQEKSGETKAAQKNRSLDQKDIDQKLAREKFETEFAEKLLSGALRKKADEINAMDISHADKIAAMRTAAFAEIDELQASGKVVIPK